GPVLAEGDPALMTETAPFNVSHVLRPVAAVIATGPADVAATVRWAAERGLPVAVQATGHGLFSDLAGHVLVCTHRMSWVEVDPEAGTARVGAGTRWKDVIEASPRWSSTWSRWPVSTAAGSSTRPRWPPSCCGAGRPGPRACRRTRAPRSR